MSELNPVHLALCELYSRHVDTLPIKQHKKLHLIRQFIIKVSELNRMEKRSIIIHGRRV